MSSRPTRDSGGGVLSFTFLDVLTCTMGSLVLLVVILGEKAADTRLEDALRNGPRKASASGPHGEKVAEDALSEGGAMTARAAAEVAAELATLLREESDLAALRAKAARRVEEEVSRVSHLEEHERRLEHELAKLHITLQRLEDAEKRQNVDHESAERNLERLKQLIADTEQQLKNLRSEPGGKKSYAVIPYEGKNGTSRRPIYIECTPDAAIIQPEGIRLTQADFNGPTRSGNPLASAIRAAREELNERAHDAGDLTPPDPYPLILVRPGAERTFSAVIHAVESWDVQYGYELIDADWDLEFPETDPKLVQAMTHAVDQARGRLALLARAAPRTYGAAGMMGPTNSNSPKGSRSSSGGSGIRLPDASISNQAGNSVGGAPASTFLGAPQEASSAQVASSNRPARGAEEHHYGEIRSDERAAETGNFADLFGPPPSAVTAESSQAAAAPNTMQPAGAGGTVSSEGVALSSGAKPDVHSAPVDPAAAAMAGSVGVPGTAPDNSNLMRVEDRQPAESAAEKRGVNWANAAASRRASPVTRPIWVLVRADRLDLIGESDGSQQADAKVVSFQQPTNQVLDELAAEVQQHIKDWGLAGNAMYWRPTLVLQVAPGAEKHAIRLNDLLRDSGVDVRFQDTAARPRQELLNGTR